MFTRSEKIQLIIFAAALVVCFVPFAAIVGTWQMLGSIAICLFHFVLTVIAANFVWHFGCNVGWWV